MSDQVLAVIGQVKEVAPIEGADRIVAATVVCGRAGVWRGVVGKDMAVGDKVTVFLQDAILPQDERWAFMEKHQWRVRMAKFKSVPSECLILASVVDAPVGTDVTGELGVTKYHKAIPVAMQGDAVGAFPSFIPRTDEDNFQRVPETVALMADSDWYATEKADGTSCTVWNDEQGMHVCSRNWELREFSAAGKGNAYWQVARKYGLDRLPPKVALQFEVIGPGIQGNPMGLAEIDGRAFTAFDIDSQRRLPYEAMASIAGAVGMPVATVMRCGRGAVDEADLRRMAEFKYASGKQAEGVVVRCLESRWSFKVLNLGYKEAA